jgi:cell division protein FtsQ
VNTTTDPAWQSGMAQVRWMNRACIVLMLVCVGLLAWGAGSLFLNLPTWKLQNIEIKGEFTHLPLNNLHQDALGEVQGNYLTVNLRQVKAAFEAMPWVHTAKIDRKWPMQLQVHLSEHVPAAYWGGQGQNTMVNAQGRLFTAEGFEDPLPVLIGQDEYAKTMWDAYRNLAPIYQKMKLELTTLERDNRGGWRARLDNGAVIELGRGDPAALAARSEQLVTHIQTVLVKHGRAARHLQYADLRYPQGFALRLEGLSVAGQNAPSNKTQPAPISDAGHVQRTSQTRNHNG